MNSLEIIQDKYERIKLYNEDCLIAMNYINDKSVDMILCDLPYGVLNRSNKNVKWDKIIPFDKLWEQYLRIIKDNGAIVLFGSGMFTSDLMQSQRKYWRYNLIWDKVCKTGFLNSKRMPLRQHEDICVFYKKSPTYNPQMTKGKTHKRTYGSMNGDSHTDNCYGKWKVIPTQITDEYFPSSIISINKDTFENNSYHPTQKPIRLLEWLIKTYTNEEELVLDNCMGGGSTGVACVNTNRKFIGIELDKNYFDTCKKRILL